MELEGMESEEVPMDLWTAKMERLTAVSTELEASSKIIVQVGLRFLRHLRIDRADRAMLTSSRGLGGSLRVSGSLPPWWRAGARS